MFKPFLLVLALLPLPLAQPALAGDPIVDFATKDPKMRNAIRQAQATLPKFLAAVTQSDNSLHEASMVKVAVPVENGPIEDEVIWVDNITRNGEQFTGHLANEPNHIPNAHQGTKIKFKRTSIYDWSLWGSDQKLYGNYTTRIMLPELPAETAAHLNTILSAEPSPW